jgi:hypothetical protein
MHQPIQFVGAMITPAVLISAAALLLLSTAGRLGRVNDRLQQLLTEAGLPSAQKHKQFLSLELLPLLQERLMRLRSAVTGLYTTIALLVVTSIVGDMDVLFPNSTGIVLIGVAMLGAIAFLYSIMLLMQEASIAARVTLQEIAYVRDLLDQQNYSQVHRQAG